MLPLLITKSWIDPSLSILKYSSTAVAAIAAVIGIMGETRDPVTRKLNKLGRLAIGVVGLSLVCAFGIQIIESERDRIKTEEEALKDEENKQKQIEVSRKQQLTISELNKVLSVIKSSAAAGQTTLDKATKINEGMQKNLAAQKNLFNEQESAHLDIYRIMHPISQLAITTTFLYSEHNNEFASYMDRVKIKANQLIQNGSIILSPLGSPSWAAALESVSAKLKEQHNALSQPSEPVTKRHFQLRDLGEVPRAIKQALRARSWQRRKDLLDSSTPITERTGALEQIKFLDWTGYGNQILVRTDTSGNILRIKIINTSNNDLYPLRSLEPICDRLLNSLNVEVGLFKNHNSLGGGTSKPSKAIKRYRVNIARNDIDRFSNEEKLHRIWLDSTAINDIVQYRQNPYKTFALAIDYENRTIEQTVSTNLVFLSKYEGQLTSLLDIPGTTVKITNLESTARSFYPQLRRVDFYFDLDLAQRITLKENNWKLFAPAEVENPLSWEYTFPKKYTIK